MQDKSLFKCYFMEIIEENQFDIKKIVKINKSNSV